jgi:4,5:9,10-diseco-3-hydroxy-5,9,17-trioxoandrosta-1(10),2-diene-4-oate hydrolase
MAETLPEPTVIDTSECSVSFRDMGEGPALLLLHGGGPGATGVGNFRGNALGLQDRFRVILPDHPGFGASRVVNDSGSTYRAVSAKAMAELLAALDIDKAHVVGNSMGGGVALTMALHHAARVDRLVLMGPWFPGFGIPLFAPLPVPLLQQYYPNPSLEKMRSLIRAFVFDADFEGFEALAKSRYEASLDPEIEAGYLRMSTGTEPDPDPRPVFDQFADLSNDALLLWGRDDRFCALDDAFMYLAALRRSRLIIFRETGHWVQAERVQEFNSEVAAFLGS